MIDVIELFFCGRDDPRVSFAPYFQLHNYKNRDEDILTILVDKVNVLFYYVINHFQSSFVEA
jgi:hypothetical protein